MRYLLGLVLGIQLISCKTSSEDGSTLQEAVVELKKSPNQIKNIPEWNAYVAEATKDYPIQEACAPASFKHKGELKGVVVLFHGFTACAQQFFAVAQQLQAKGWDVLLPLNPGHGMVRRLETAEDSLLPIKDNYKEVNSDFVKKINGILHAYPAKHKVVGGASLGGAMATAAMIYDPSLYERGLILTPFFQMSGMLGQIIGGLKNIDNWTHFIDPNSVGALSKDLLNRNLGWGPNCEDEETKGRQGICNFSFNNLIATQQFGYDLSETEVLRGHVQFIGVDGDLAAEVNRIKWFFENHVQGNSSSKHICLYRKPALHSLASRYDMPDQDKFWLPTFEVNLVNFIVDGTFFLTSDNKINGIHECLVDK